MKTIFSFLVLAMTLTPLTALSGEPAKQDNGKNFSTFSQSPRHRLPKALSQEAFNRIVKLAQAVSFSDDRMRLLEAALLERFITSSQCRRLLHIMADFDDERLKIISFIGNRITDPENIIDILDEFSFEDGRNKAKAILCRQIISITDTTPCKYVTAPNDSPCAADGYDCGRKS